jgi:hypothetical protein
VYRYHSWSYDSSGKNIGITAQREGCYPDSFAAANHDLILVLRFAEYRGFLFASFNPDVPTLDEHLGGARTFLDTIADQAPTASSSYPATFATRSTRTGRSASRTRSIRTTSRQRTARIRTSSRSARVTAGKPQRSCSRTNRSIAGRFSSNAARTCRSSHQFDSVPRRPAARSRPHRDHVVLRDADRRGRRGAPHAHPRIPRLLQPQWRSRAVGVDAGRDRAALSGCGEPRPVGR